jgi:hypothetical protein
MQLAKSSLSIPPFILRSKIPSAFFFKIKRLTVFSAKKKQTIGKKPYSFNQKKINKTLTYQKNKKTP